MDKIKIFVCLDHYLPGNKSGGPVVSIANMVETISDQFQFYILTRDRDWTETMPYAGVQTNKWVSVGRGQVYYASQEALSLRNIQKLLSDVNPDILYLNSLLSTLTNKLLLLRYLNVIAKIPTVVAPRGEFSSGALTIKVWKKRPYLALTSLVRFHKNIIWHASTQQEKTDIEAYQSLRIMKNTASLIRVAQNIADKSATHKTQSGSLTKNAGYSKFVSISRVSRMKGLIHALQWLSLLSGEIEYGIYGIIDDPAYWEECSQIISKLPVNVTVKHYGHIAHHDVPGILAQYHFFLLPTLGENYGHAIVEALEALVPVVISDNTPWHDLFLENAGWDIALTDVDAWRRALQTCVDMEHEQYSRMKQSVSSYLLKHLPTAEIIQANIDMFLLAYNLKDR